MAQLRLIPRVGATGSLFDLQRVDYSTTETSGRLYGVSAGWPHWSLTLDLNNLMEPDASAWDAFLLSLRGQQRPFLAYDLWRPLPLAHADGFARMTTIGGMPFLGAASGWSQAITADSDAELTLQGIPSGLVLSLGDYVGFKWDAAGSPVGSYDRRALVKVVAGAKAASDGTITATVEPPVHNIVPPGAVAHLDTPCCLMRLVTDQTKLGRRVLPSHIEAGSKIVAAQDLRA